MQPEALNPLALGIHRVRIASGGGLPAYERLIVLDLDATGTKLLRIRWAKVSAWLYDGTTLDLWVDGMPHLRLREVTPRQLHWLNWALSEQDRTAAPAPDVRNGQEVRT